MLALITTFLTTWSADRTGERYFHVTVPFYVSIAAFILVVATTAFAPRYVAMMLMIPGVYTGYVVALGWISNTIPRPPAKRAAALAIVNAFSNLSQIYASYMYTGAPQYGKPPTQRPVEVKYGDRADKGGQSRPLRSIASRPSLHYCVPRCSGSCWSA